MEAEPGGQLQTEEEDVGWDDYLQSNFTFSKQVGVCCEDGVKLPPGTESFNHSFTK